MWFLLACSTPEPVWVRGTPNPPDPSPEAVELVRPSDGSMVECDAVYAGPGQRWYTYEDNACQHGSSSSTLEVLPGDLPGITCPLHWTGEVGQTVSNGFSGISTELGLSKLGSYERIVISVRGSGRMVRIRFPMLHQLVDAEKEEDGCSSKDYDMFGKVFACGDGSNDWQEVAIELGQLSQEGWGRPWMFDRNDIYQLQLQSADSSPGQFVCDFRILRLER